MTESREILVSSVRTDGDLAGVFEYDGDTGYFYLYAVGPARNRVMGAIQLLTGNPDFGAEDVRVCWSADEKRVGLLIHNAVWALFDTTNGAQLGGPYCPGAVSPFPGPDTYGFEEGR